MSDYAARTEAMTSASSGDGDSGSSDPAAASAIFGGDSDRVSSLNGHRFRLRTFKKLAFCKCCNEILWGIINQGLVCRECGYVVHDKCSRSDKLPPCQSILDDLVPVTRQHHWINSRMGRRRYCNYCHRKAGQLAQMCQICDVVSHQYCVKKTINSCRRVAISQIQCKAGEAETSCSGGNTSAAAMRDPPHHHWTNTTFVNATKCGVCRKTTLNNDAYNVFMCQWCRRVAHWPCIQSQALICDFGWLLSPHDELVNLQLGNLSGALNSLLLPPDVVALHSDINELQLEHYLSRHLATGSEKDEEKAASATAAVVTDDCHNEVFRSISSPSSSSSSATVLPDDDSESSGGREAYEKSSGSMSSDKGSKTFALFDGDAAIGANSGITVIMHSNATGTEFLQNSLEMLHISQHNEQHFYLVDQRYDEFDVDETIIQLNLNLSSQLGSANRVLLRHRPSNNGYVKVYNPNEYRVTFRNIFYNKDMTFQQLLEFAIKKFEFANTAADKYELVATKIRGPYVSEGLDLAASVSSWLHNLRQSSIRSYYYTRIFVRPSNREPIRLFVSGFNSGLQQKQYEAQLSDILRGCVWDELEIIFYEYGSLVLIYYCAVAVQNAIRLLHAHPTTTPLLLPEINDSLLGEMRSPLLVFVNPRSGGCQGAKMIEEFRRILNPFQVFDLTLGGPLPGLFVFRKVYSYRILACGGDGTVGWVLSCLDNIGQDAMCPTPSIAIFPVGTGNDLSRVLQWGPGLVRNEDLAELLATVIDSEEVKLDRWAVTLSPQQGASIDRDDVTKAPPSNLVTPKSIEDNSTVIVMNNYFGVGLDADLALDFDLARKKKPDQFNSRLHNKGVYVMSFLQKWMQSNRCKQLENQLKLVVDGNEIDLPSLEGIVVGNIQSWGSGCDLWGGETSDKFAKPTQYDGKLEVVGLTGMPHVAQIQSGIRSGIRLAQGEHIQIIAQVDLPVQVDGEPWIQPAGQINIRRSALRATMLKKVKPTSRRRTTATSRDFEFDSEMDTFTLESSN